MEELFNRPILDQLYDSISDDFETMLLKKKNSDGKFTESLKVEEELIYLIGIKAMIMMMKSKKISLMVWNYK